MQEENISDKAKIAFTVAAAMAIGYVPTMLVFNGAESYAEFQNVSAQIRKLATDGSLKDTDGSPKPYVYKAPDGQEYTITVDSALITQNGSYRNASGQTSSDEQTDPAQGAISSQSRSAQYELTVTIARTKGQHTFGRVFYNDGGTRTNTYTWAGGKPNGAPLSSQQKFVLVPVTPLAVPAAAPAVSAKPAP